MFVPCESGSAVDALAQYSAQRGALTPARERVTRRDIDHTFTFDLGTGVKHDQHVVLQFFYVSSSNANNLSFRFSINGTEVRTINVTGNYFATSHQTGERLHS